MGPVGCVKERAAFGLMRNRFVVAMERQTPQF